MNWGMAPKGPVHRRIHRGPSGEAALWKVTRLYTKETHLRLLNKALVWGAGASWDTLRIRRLVGAIVLLSLCLANPGRHHLPPTALYFPFPPGATFMLQPVGATCTLSSALLKPVGTIFSFFFCFFYFPLFSFSQQGPSLPSPSATLQSSSISQRETSTRIWSLFSPVTCFLQLPPRGCPLISWSAWLWRPVGFCPLVPWDCNNWRDSPWQTATLSALHREQAKTHPNLSQK